MILYKGPMPNTLHIFQVLSNCKLSISAQRYLHPIFHHKTLNTFCVSRRDLSIINDLSNFGPIPNSLHIFQVHLQCKLSMYCVILHQIFHHKILSTSSAHAGDYSTINDLSLYQSQSAKFWFYLSLSLNLNNHLFRSQIILSTYLNLPVICLKYNSKSLIITLLYFGKKVKNVRFIPANDNSRSV